MPDLLKLAEQSAKVKEYEAAERHCLSHLASSPVDPQGLRLLAFIHSLQDRYVDAVSVVSKVIDFSKGKAEPVDRFNRGRWNLQLGNFADAASDFSNVVKLCELYGDDYYLESGCLLRAVALARMGLVADAGQALQKVSDDCQAFAMGQLYSKHSLLNEMEP